MQDISKVLTLVPGKKKLNLHASYAIIDDGSDRDSIKPKHFTRWVEFAKKYNIPVYITEEMIGHKLGEFAPTRTFKAAEDSGTEVYGVLQWNR